FAAFIFVLWRQTVGGGSALPAADVPDPFLGAEAAAVEIVEYGDFGCPACRAWHNAGIREQVLQNYGDRVRFVWKDFPVITRYSPKAAEAAHCAAAQGKFWAYHDFLYEQTSNIQVDGLKQAAAALGLDQTAFDQCLDEGQMAEKVRVNENEARRYGFRGTPAFALNGQPLPGPPSYQQLATRIEQALQ
ncbi:MAG: hypothetical protein D6790_05820, partial [Caldilineae bacterium]